MTNQFQSRKKFQQKLVVSFSFFGLLVAACSPSVQSVASNPALAGNNISFPQEDTVKYSQAVEAVNPHTTEKNYVETNYKKYLDQALNDLNAATTPPKSVLSLTSPEVIEHAKKLIQPEAADYAHFKYIADRTVSLKWTTLKPGSLFYGGSYGTGWIVDRFKNPDGSWSNDFLVSTNIHVINTIPSSTNSGIGSNNDYSGFPSDVYELAVNNQVYDPQNPDPNWMYPSSFAKLPNWDPQNYFAPKRRALVNQIENNYEVNPYYSLSFSGAGWSFRYFGSDIRTPTTKILREAYPRSENTNWYDVKRLSNYLLTKIRGSKRYFNQLLFDQTNISEVSSNQWETFYEKYQSKLDTQFIHDAANKIPNHAKTLDNGFLKITIPDSVLANKLPVFLDPSKYNEWTFPKFAQQDPFKTYSYHNYDEPYGFIPNQTRTYDLLKSQQEPIWHLGYPAEQTWNGLAYNSPGPILKTNRGLITNAIFSNPSSKNSLDHNECQIYNSLCNDDGVYPAVYSLGSEGSNTGGGSSGSMALNKNYEVQGIYWGVRFNFGSLLNYNSHGLYEPMYSSSKLNLPSFERIPALTTKNKGVINYSQGIDGESTSTPKPFEDLLKTYLRGGLKKVFVATKTDDTFNQISKLKKLKSFNYATDLKSQVATVMQTLTDNNPSALKEASFASLTSNTNNLSSINLLDQLYTAIKNYWKDFVQKTTEASASEYQKKFNKNLDIIASAMEKSVTDINFKYQNSRVSNSIIFTAFVKRDLGTVNMAGELKKYFQENSYESHVYNNLANPLKIANEAT